MKNFPLSQWIENFNLGIYDSKNVETQVNAGWYDWFCRDSSLRGKTYSLAAKVKQVAKSTKINVDTMYVFFKNNCPVNGALYDDFRICDLKTGDVIFTIVPKSGFFPRKGITEIWGRENGFKTPLYEGNWKGALKWFNV